MSEDAARVEIYKKAQIAFKKLSPKDGDIVVIKFPDNIHPQQMETFAEHMDGIIPEGVTIFCTRSAVEIDCLPKQELNDLGWYNINTGNESIN